MKKVYIVDDDRDILEAIGILLKSEGFHVSTTTSGEDVEELYDSASELPDLILLDVLMSGTDGRNIARKLKEQPRTKQIPVLMMSAHPYAHRNIEEYRADDFIAKPFDIDYFLDKIRAYC